MPINPNIALSFQAPQIDDPLNKMAQIEQIKAYRQNALAREREAQLAEREIENMNALRKLYAGGESPTFEQAYALGGQQGAEIFATQAKAKEAQARQISAERKALMDTVNIGRTSLAATPDDPSAYGQWRQSFVSQYPEMEAFFPSADQYMPAGAQQMGTKRQLLLSADQLAKDENALERLNAQLKSQREIAEENRLAALQRTRETLESQEQRTMASLRSQEDRARLQRELDAEKTKYSRDLKAREMDPEYQERMAEAKARGTAIAKSDVEAKSQLPNVVANAELGIDLINQLVGKPAVTKDGKVVSPATEPHPGFSGVVGVGFGERFIPGTSAASADALLDQVLGGAYLEAFETLKGGGQITVEEGKAATKARTRMSRAQSEKEFIDAAREYQSYIMKGVERAKAKAGASSSLYDEVDTIVGIK